MASLISDSWSEEKEGRWCRISQINCSFMVSSVFEDMIPDLGVISELSNNLTTSFQAGVNTLYNACVSCGVTPSAKTPAAISAAISAISTNRYNAGRTQGQNDVKGSPNSYGLYTGAQYTANYNAGYNAGVTAGQAIPRSKDFRLSLSFNDNSASAVLDTPSGGAAFISVNQSTKNSWARKNATITI